MEGKVKETEAITVKNAEEEDKFENKISKAGFNISGLLRFYRPYDI